MHFLFSVTTARSKTAITAGDTVKRRIFCLIKIKITEIIKWCSLTCTTHLSRSSELTVSIILSNITSLKYLWILGLVGISFLVSLLAVCLSVCLPQRFPSTISFPLRSLFLKNLSVAMQRVEREIFQFFSVNLTRRASQCGNDSKIHELDDKLVN